MTVSFRAIFANARGGKRDLFSLTVLALAIAAVYGPALGAPWYLDDLPAIIDNPLIRDPGACLRQLFSPRGLVNLTFAGNYQLGRLDPAGYRLLNGAIHLGASALVYLLLKRVFAGAPWLPLFGALLFAVHPLQTQAVTYVVQRMTSLAGLLVFLALYLYVLARERLNRGGRLGEAGHLLRYLGALLAAGLALRCKENAAVLPALLWLYDRYFLADQRSRRARLRYLAPFLVAPALVALGQLLLPLLAGTSLLRLAGLHGAGEVSALHYLLTEFSVVWIYLRLLLLPFGQALLHEYPVVEHLFDAQSLVAGLALAALIWGAWRWRKTQPWLSFGIAWFLVALTVESTLIPLDPLFEHRLYVPLFGFVVALVGLAARLPQPGVALAVVGVACLVCAPLAWSRNRLWTDPVAFYQDNLRLVPHSERVLLALANLQAGEGRPEEAEAILRQSLSQQPTLHGYINLLRLYEGQGRLQDGFALAQQGLREFPDSAHLHEALGLFAYRLGDPALALHSLQQAVTIDPQFASGYASLGKVFFSLRRWPEAEEHFRRSLSLNPGDGTVHSDLAVVLHSQNRLPEARHALRQALQLDPDHVPSLLRLGALAAETGDRITAQAMLQRLQALNAPESARVAALLR